MNELLGGVLNLVGGGWSAQADPQHTEPQMQEAA